MSVKRYDHMGMADELGVWVRWTDYDAACAERDRALTALGEMSESYVRDTKAHAALVAALREAAKVSTAARKAIEEYDAALKAAQEKPHG